MTTAADLAAELNAHFGEGTVLMGNDPSLLVDFLPTSVIPVDMLLGGGLPRGRFTEIFGDYSSLKSYVALCAIATTQEAGGTCAIIDTEHSYDPDWLRAIGGDPDDLIVKRPDTAEEAVKLSEVMVRAGVDLLVWDSVAASQTLAEAEKEAGEDKQPARLAQMMSKATKRINSVNKKTAVLWINQTRINVGMVFGNPETTPGGKALPYYASYRIRFTKGGKIREPVKIHDGEKWVNTKETVAQKIKMTVEKSKLSKPHRESWFLFDLRTASVDDATFLFAQALEHGLLEVKGSSYRLPHDDAKPVRGKDNFIQMLREDEGELDWLYQEVLKTAGART